MRSHPKNWSELGFDGVDIDDRLKAYLEKREETEDFLEWLSAAMTVKANAMRDTSEREFNFESKYRLYDTSWAILPENRFPTAELYVRVSTGGCAGYNERQGDFSYDWINITLVELVEDTLRSKTILEYIRGKNSAGIHPTAKQIAEDCGYSVSDTHNILIRLGETVECIGTRLNTTYKLKGETHDT
jgi:hypothetical protein